MQFNVASLLKEPTGAIREFDIDDDLLIERERHHVTGHVRFDRTNIGRPRARDHARRAGRRMQPLPAAGGVRPQDRRSRRSTCRPSTLTPLHP